MKRLMGSLLLTSLILLSHTNLTYGATGSRMNPEKQTTGEVAAAHYNRASRLTLKAEEYERQASLADSEKARAKDLTKAKKQYKKAASLYKKAMAKSPRLSGIRTELGHALIKTGNYTEALALLEEDIERGQDSTRTIAYRTEALICMGHLDEAKQAYEELGKLDSAEADLLARGILVSIRSGELDSSPEIRTWLEDNQSMAGSSK